MSSYLKIFLRGKKTHKAAKLAKRLLERLCIRLARLAMKPLSMKTSRDPYHLLFQKFVQKVNTLDNARLLEIGSRARSGNIATCGFSSSVHYQGMDILPGSNVDIVGDIHSMSKKIPAASQDALFCISVFEHLAMPWKAALEINKILKPDGLVFIATHPTWPLHDRPWDFFRYSTDGFRALFHRLTGFEIIDATEGLPCRIIPFGTEASMRKIECQAAFLGVAVLARKTGPPDPKLSWDIDLQEFLTTHYPA